MSQMQGIRERRETQARSKRQVADEENQDETAVVLCCSDLEVIKLCTGREQAPCSFRKENMHSLADHSFFCMMHSFLRHSQFKYMQEGLKAVSLF